MVHKTFFISFGKTEYNKKELKFANLNFTMQVRYVFQAAGVDEIPGEVIKNGSVI